MDALIKRIENSLQQSFLNTISLHKVGNGQYKLTSIDCSNAKDLHKNYFDDVTVVKWIDNYWLKLFIHFKKIEIETVFNPKTGINKTDYLTKLREDNFSLNNDFFETNISISIFKGDYDCFSKYQLFRAEWDNYKTKQNKHPQPHWQFYQLDEYRKKLNELSSDVEFSSDKKDSGFEDFLDNKIDLKKFHFAMNGNWINNGSHIHALNNEEKIKNWLKGVLTHIQIQLEFLNISKP